MKFGIILAWHFQKISNYKYYPKNIHGYYISYISQDNSEFSFLFSDLNNRNGTYASLAFISGVEHKNPSTGCETTVIWKCIKFT